MKNIIYSILIVSTLGAGVAWGAAESQEPNIAALKEAMDKADAAIDDFTTSLSTMSPKDMQQYQILQLIGILTSIQYWSAAEWNPDLANPKITLETISDLKKEISGFITETQDLLTKIEELSSAQ